MVISDYASDKTDESLVYAIDINIQYIEQNNVTSNTSNSSITIDQHTNSVGHTNNLYGVGYVWGKSIRRLIYPDKYYQNVSTNSIVTGDGYANYCISKLEHRIDEEDVQRVEGSDKTIPESDKFDVIILADLIFNRSEHQKLLWTVKQCLKDTGKSITVMIITYNHCERLIFLGTT